MSRVKIKVLNSMNHMVKKILICGGTGFIGRNIASYFASDPQNEVFATYNLRPAYAHPRLTWIKVNLTDQEKVTDLFKNVDIVVHAAAKTGGIGVHNDQELDLVTDNAVMNAYIFRAASQSGVSHVIFLSCTIFLPTIKRPLKETDFDGNFELEQDYFGPGWTKIYSEKLCELYSRNTKTKFTVIRHSDVFGPYDNFDPYRSHVLASTLLKVIKAEKSITVWGDGNTAKDFIYIDDLVNLIKKCISNQAQKYGIYNCGSGEITTITNLATLIIEISNKSIKIEYDLSKKKITRHLCLDTAKASHELGWKIENSLRVGLEKTYNWCLEQPFAKN